MTRFILQPSQEPEMWVCTDTKNGIVCRFVAHDFNNTQEFTFLDDIEPDALNISRCLREMGDWLVAHYSNIVF